MYKRDIINFGETIRVTCDGKCTKAWGLGHRPRTETGEQVPDDELGTAPENPGTHEEHDYKPLPDEEKLNRWCVRECERSVTHDPPKREFCNNLKAEVLEPCNGCGTCEDE